MKELSNPFDTMESNVRLYCRDFEGVFHTARGAALYDSRGTRYIDFLAGAGALNYGHNNPYIKKQLISWLAEDGVMHALDMHTTAKRDFLQTFSDLVLQPKKLNYKIQFCGPTGTNAVEAALKLARKVTGRPGIFAFSGGYHGLSLGSLAVTSNAAKRGAAGIPLAPTTFFPYGGADEPFDALAYMESLLSDDHAGVQLPAAVIFETVQAEGGVNVAPVAWLRRLRALCDRHGIPLICDDIQVGCMRTGPFFSFERAGIEPDMVTLSKSISGYGGPMALLLMKPELDRWAPGEHTGTFRGYQLAMVGAKAALEFARNARLEQAVAVKGEFVRRYLEKEIRAIHPEIGVRGIGMIWGLDVSGAGGGALAREVVAACYRRGLIVERTGRSNAVLKILPPLTIETELLEEGCSILKDALSECLCNCSTERMAAVQ